MLAKTSSLARAMSPTGAYGGAKRSLLARCLSVATMLGMYCLAVLAISSYAIDSADAAPRGGRGGGRGMARGGRGGGGGMRGGGRGRGGVVRGRGSRGSSRGRGRGRGFYRGGIWFPWIGPGICHHPWTSARVICRI
jgi:hypothetical protein